MNKIKGLENVHITEVNMQTVTVVRGKGCKGSRLERIQMNVKERQNMVHTVCGDAFEFDFAQHCGVKRNLITLVPKNKYSLV